MKSEYTIVIPVYNEEKSLKELIEKLKIIREKYNILLIDDCSRDNSANILKENKFEVISHPYNKGYGASLKTGIRNSKSPYIIIMDADMQHDPEKIDDLIKEKNKYDMVIGARDSKSHFPIFRRPGKFLINKFASYVAGFNIQDINSGFRVFEKEHIIRFLNILPNGFSFTTTSTLLYIKGGFSIKYIPINVKKRIGTSSVKISDGFNTLLLILKTLIIFCPMKFFIPTSIAVFLSGIGELIYEFYLLNRFNFSTSASLLFICSILIFLFGLISEQISQLKRIEK